MLEQEFDELGCPGDEVGVGGVGLGLDRDHGLRLGGHAGTFGLRPSHVNLVMAWTRGRTMAQYLHMVEISMSPIALAQWGAGLIWPSPLFGSPVQRAKERHLSWWHVPVHIRAPLVGRSSIDRCNVHMRMHRDDPYGDRLIDLRWQSKDKKEGDSETDLRPGIVKLVPVAWREEGSDRNAYITDQQFLMAGQRGLPLEPLEGKHKFKLIVQAGEKSWEAPHFYIIRVHDMESNGHFVVEQEYEGRGTKAFTI